MDKRKEKSRKKYGWYSGSSEEEVRKDMEEKGYKGKYERLKEGLKIKDEDKDPEKKKSRFNIFS